MDDFERLLMTQSFRVALLNVVVNTDGPCGLISCFFPPTTVNSLTPVCSSLETLRSSLASALVRLAPVYSPRPMGSSPLRSIP